MFDLCLVIILVELLGACMFTTPGNIYLYAFETPSVTFNPYVVGKILEIVIMNACCGRETGTLSYLCNWI